MARPLNEKFAELPAARREKIEARAAELVAEEMSLRDLDVRCARREPRSPRTWALVETRWRVTNNAPTC
jgi:hypothetical protein